MRLLLGALVLALLAASVQSLRLEARQADVARLALTADSLEAIHDSTRELRAAAALLGDSLRVVQRRIVQVKQRSDSLDRLLKNERRARAVLTATVAPARVVANASFEGGELQAAFDVYRQPYRVLGRATLDGENNLKLDWFIRLDSATLEVRIGCGARRGRRVRSAEVGVVTPTWLQARLLSVEQDPEVCNPPVATRRSRIGRALARTNLTVGYGLTRRSDGVLAASPALVLGWRVWP